MRRTQYYRAGSWIILGACLTASAALVGCGDERNQKPTVEISASSLEIIEGDQVSIDGSQSSDPDGDPLRFYWEIEVPEGSDVALNDPRTQSITLVADTPGTYTVSLSVSDGEFRTEPKSVAIEASAYVVEEGAPVAHAGVDRTVEAGTEVELDGSASVDPDGDPLTYAWTIHQAPAGSVAGFGNPTAVKPRFTPNKLGDYLIGLKVSDGTHTSREAQVTITVVEEIDENGEGPIADAGDNQQVAIGARVELDGSDSKNPNGALDELSYFWTFDIKPAASGTIAINRPFSTDAWFMPDAEGTYVMRLEVRDAQERLSTDTVTILVERLPSDACLMISEYVQGSGTNKAVELYNCGDSPLDLNRFRFCMFTNDETTSCTKDTDILRDDASHPDGMDRLSAGDVLTLCESRISESVFDVADCDKIEGTNLFYLTGDDRFLIYEDTDESETFGGVDLVVDAFGQTAVQPGSEIWKNKTYQRCNFELYDGRSPFEVTDYFNIRSTDYFVGFGEVPTEQCD